MQKHLQRQKANNKELKSTRKRYAYIILKQTKNIALIIRKGCYW